MRRIREILNKVFEHGFWRDYVLDVHKRLNYSRAEFTMFLVTCTVFIATSAMLTPPSFYAPPHPWLRSLKYVWLFYLPIAMVIVYSLYRYNPRTDFGSLRRSKQTSEYRVIFQIVTRGYEVEAVKRGVESVMFWAPRYLKNFEVWIVTEEDLPETSRIEFEHMKKIYGDRLRVLYVPKDYETARKTKYKARALCYALEVRRRLGYVDKYTWIYLMDEESVVGEDTVISIVEFIEKSYREGRMAAQGMVVYSNFWGKNILTSLFDSVRPLQDLTLMKFQYEKGRPLFAVHGSHMLIRCDLESRIGWDFGPVMAEDLIFGLISSSKAGRVWGWLRGKLYEQSPFSLRDLIKQRRRWVWGIIDVLKHKDVSKRDKLLVGLNYLLWLGGLPAAAVSVLNILVPTPLPSMAIIPFLGLLMAVWLYMYWEGCKINLWSVNIDRKLKKVLQFVALALAPLAGIIESLAVWYAILTYPFARKKLGFELVKK